MSSNDGSKPSHPPLPPSANAFIGPGNTNLGPGPVIPDSIPSAKISRTHNDDAQPQRKSSQGTSGTGAAPTKRVHDDGRSRLGSDADDEAFQEAAKEFQQGDSNTETGQGGASNPFRGPGGIKLGHGPRVDHLEKNEDGSYKMKKDGE